MEVKIIDIARYFNCAPAAFAAEWKAMSDEDKAEIRVGVAAEIAAGRFVPAPALAAVPAAAC